MNSNLSTLIQSHMTGRHSTYDALNLHLGYGFNSLATVASVVSALSQPWLSASKEVERMIWDRYRVAHGNVAFRRLNMSIVSHCEQEYKI